jgi:hypothetical protein
MPLVGESEPLTPLILTVSVVPLLESVAEEILRLADA